jgi:YHS domain-containing protein
MRHSPSIRAAFLALAIGATAGLAALPAFAFDQESASAVNVDKGGLALRGYDPVAYHTAGKATKGDAQFNAKHNGATYHFASAANRDAFVKEPAKFEPAYGGFCAFAASVGKKFDGDPELWKIVDGKVYINVNPDVVKRWEQDVPGNITKANQNWTNIKDKAPKGL